MTGSSFLSRELGVVAAKLVEHETARRLVLAPAPPPPPLRRAGALVSRRRRSPTGVGSPGWRTRERVGAEFDEHLCGHALTLADEAEQDVLGPDVVVAELQRLAQREALQHLLGPGRERDVPARALSPCPMISSTWAWTASSEMPSDSSALAATPSPSWIRPSRMCSVPMQLWLRRRASSWARTTTPGSVGEAFEQCLALSVSRCARDSHAVPVATESRCAGRTARPRSRSPVTADGGAPGCSRVT